MKILFVTDLYPVERCEITTPQTLHNFVKEWIKLGHEVEVIKPNFLMNSFLRGKKFYKTGFYEFDGVKIFNVNYWTPFLFDVKRKLVNAIEKQNRRKEGKKERGKAFLPSLLPSCSQNFDFDYDIIIAHMPSGIIFANKLRLDAPLFCGVHCSDIEILTNPLYKFYFKKQLEDVYKKAKKIACRSHVLQKKFNALMPNCAEKTFVASSGVKIEGKRERGKEVKTLDEPSLLPSFPPSLKILACANLIKRKNIDKLILAVNDLEDFELKIIGDGKELKHLSRVGSLTHQAKIEFLGRLPHEKVLEEMQKSDIFILPSVNETFGMVYLEAMSSGCITVCTKNDAIDGIIQDGENGFLTEPTVEGIKETLLRIKNCGAHGAPYSLEQIRHNSLETIKEYTPENCAKKYLENIMQA